MVSHREARFYTELLVDILCKIRSKRRATVGAMHKGNPVVLPYVLDVQLHEVGCRDVGSRWYEMSHLSETIGHDIDRIESVGPGQFPHKV